MLDPTAKRTIDFILSSMRLSVVSVGVKLNILFFCSSYTNIYNKTGGLWNRLNEIFIVYSNKFSFPFQKKKQLFSLLSGAGRCRLSRINEFLHRRLPHMQNCSGVHRQVMSFFFVCFVFFFGFSERENELFTHRLLCLHRQMTAKLNRKDSFKHRTQNSLFQPVSLLSDRCTLLSLCPLRSCSGCTLIDRWSVLSDVMFYTIR